LGFLCSASSLLHADSAVRQFSSSDNPNGHWSYGLTKRLGGAFTLLTSGSCDNLLGWQLKGAEPWVLGNPTGSTEDCGTGQDPTSLLDMHPGSKGQYSVVRWTAPNADQFVIEGLFEGIDPRPTTTDVHVLLNGVPIFSRKVNSFMVPVRFKLTEPLRAGDKIDFAVGYGTDKSFLFDSTGFNATINKEMKK
jgi:hypothetical protein